MAQVHTVYFVRHGECEGNVSGEILSPELDFITVYGKKQAAALGEYLNDVHFNSAHVSTYQRAIETAKEILAKSTIQCSEALKMDKRICERDMGDFIGLQQREVIRSTIMKKLLEGQKLAEIEVPGGETVAEYIERIRSFFQDLFENLRSAQTPQTILIVSHGLTMRHFMKGLVDIYSDVCDVSNWDKKCGAAIKNTAVTQFTVEFPVSTKKPLIRFLKINGTEHLDSLEEETGTKHAPMSDEQKRLIEKLCQIPGVREEISSCVQV